MLNLVVENPKPEELNRLERCLVDIWPSNIYKRPDNERHWDRVWWQIMAISGLYRDPDILADLAWLRGIACIHIDRVQDL